MKLRRTIDRPIAKHRLGTRSIQDQRHRMVSSAAFGFSLNLLYAFYHGMLGIGNPSPWFLTMCAYYTVLGTMRLSAVLYEYRYGATASSDEGEYLVMKLSGVLLIILSLVLAGGIYISLSRNVATKHGEIVMITIATYTFYKLTAAIIRAVKQRKDPSPLLAVIRGIGYAEITGSVLTLQRSMLVSFGTTSTFKVNVMNLLTGSAGCIFVFVLGISMTIRGFRKEKHHGKIKAGSSQR